MDDFYHFLRERLHERAPEHREFEPKPAIKLDCERFAFYLPQFHRCEENDRFWGPGFTEWTNVVRALPRFLGHYQPRLPGDLGFYDLTVEDVIRRQVDIARNYGLTGFMFYFYWFGGKTVLESPIRTFLRRKDLDHKFFLMWANENWTRRWDGKEQDVLLAQTYHEDEPERFIAHVAEYFEDDRYLKVDGRPVLGVYRPSQIPKVLAVTDRWRSECVRLGFKEPYLISALAFEESEPRTIGFDATMEFPPHQYRMGRKEGPADIRSRLLPFHEALQGNIFHYAGLIKSQLTVFSRDYRMYRTALPGWDNTARRKDGKGLVITGGTPKMFSEWITALLREEMARRNEPLRMICFNAWNEWAEGAYLEPDSYYGYAYLNALYEALAGFAKQQAEPLAELFEPAGSSR
jgi:lipopolysaccharide biosynthesis protein